MGLKLGVATYAFLWTHSLEAILDQIVAWGFDHVELMATPPHVWPRTLDQKGREKLRKQFESRNLDVVALNPTFLDFNIASPNPGFQKESIAQIKEIIRLTHDLGAKILILIPGRRHPLVPQPFEQSWLTAKQAIIECAKEAELYNVIIGLENAPSLFIERSDQLRKMVEEIGSNYVQIAFDTANGAGCESLTDAIDIVKDYLVHFHVSDYDNKKWAHLPVGMGSIDFEKIGAKLRTIGFDGTSVIETTYLESFDGGVMESKAQLESLGWHT